MHVITWQKSALCSHDPLVRMVKTCHGVDLGWNSAVTNVSHWWGHPARIVPAFTDVTSFLEGLSDLLNSVLFLTCLFSHCVSCQGCGCMDKCLPLHLVCDTFRCLSYITHLLFAARFSLRSVRSSAFFCISELLVYNNVANASAGNLELYVRHCTDCASQFWTLLELSLNRTVHDDKKMSVLYTVACLSLFIIYCHIELI